MPYANAAGLSLHYHDLGAGTYPVLLPHELGAAARAGETTWPPESARDVASRIPGARFAILPEAGHFPHLQTPAALAAQAEGFFLGEPVL